MLNSIKQRRIAIAIAIALPVTAFLVWLRWSDFTLTLSREELQRRVSAAFPLDQEVIGILKVTYSHPTVKLEAGSDRIGLALEASGELLGRQFAKARVEGDWMLRYVPEEGALYFDDPRISRFEIEGVPKAVADLAANAARPLLEKHLRRTPVYRFRPGGFREDLARRTVKSVTVQDGKVYVVLGRF